MQKLLISTKFSLTSSSDTPGGNIFHILFAKFFKQILNYRVILHDPFFNSKKLLKPFCDEITEDLNLDYYNYHRIVNPLFYKGKAKDLSTSKVYNFNTKNLNKIFFVKKKNLQLISDQRFLIDKNISSLISKTFDIPYVYYLEWLARENFKTSIDLKKTKSIPIKKKQITISIHYRNDDWRLSKNILRGEEYDDYIKTLILKIKKKYINSNIIIYGFKKETGNINLFNFFINEKCLFIEDYSAYTLERAILLSNITDILIYTTNGFSDFVRYLGLAKSKLKKMIKINSLIKKEDQIHSRRILSEGILEKKFLINSNFYNNYELLKDNKLKNIDLEIKKSYRNSKINEGNFIIYYDLENINNYYFSKKIDKIIFKELLNKNKKIYKKHKILLLKKNNTYFVDGKKINKNIDFSKQQHVLTHYNIIKDYGNEYLLKNSLDFIKPLFLQKLIKENKINTSNIIYEDLLNFAIRECNMNNEIKLKPNVKNIIFINQYNPNNKKYSTNKKNLFNLIKNISMKFEEKENKQINLKWSQIIKKYKNENNVNCEVLNYLDDQTLVHIKNGKEIVEKFNIKNIEKILRKHDAIICRPNIFSLLIKFLFKNKKIILFEDDSFSNPIIKNNLFLNRSYSYLDFFQNKFTNFKEINYYLFKGPN